MLKEVLDVILTLALALGIGSIISAYLTIKYQNKKLIFETKLLKYSNLIQAYQEWVSKHDESSRQNYVAYQKQIELIATDEIVRMTEQFYHNNIAGRTSNVLTRDDVVFAMKQDLKQYY